MFKTIEFTSFWPADGEFDESGEPTIPDGRALAEAFVGQLASGRVQVGPVWDHSYYGWAFRAWHQQCSFYSVFNIVAEEGHLTMGSEAWILRWLQFRKPSRAFDSFFSVALATLGGLDGVQIVGSDAAQQAAAGDGASRRG
jgi:hypothetical protein